MTLNGVSLHTGGGSGSLTFSGPFTLGLNGIYMGGDGGTALITVNGNVTFGSGGTVISAYGSGESYVGTINGFISGGGGTLLTTNTSGAALTLAGQISGPINIYNTGTSSGATVLGNANTFTGTVRAQLGTLTVNNALGLQNATLDMNVADSGTVSFASAAANGVTLGALTGARNLALPSGANNIGNNNSTTTYTGNLSGGSLVKIGMGTLTLSSNAYTGNTTVSAGTLSIAQTNLSSSSIVTVASGAVLNLNYTGTNVVLALVLNGVNEPTGVYNNGNSGGLITGAGSIKVVGTLPNIWTGKSSATWTAANVGSPYNWSSNSVAGNYSDGSTVLFDDTLTANSSVLLTNNVSPSEVTFNNNNTNYTIGGGGSIAGACSLYKNGAGTVTLTNNYTYTGNTIINSNRLTIGTAGKLGNGNYVGSIYLANGATLEYNSINGGTLSGPITGAGGLIKDGATKCDLTLANLNTYSGQTVITNGRLFVSSQGNIGGGTTIVQTNQGQLYISTATILTNAMNLSSTGYPEADANNNFDGAVRCDASSSLLGTITLSGNARIANYAASGATLTIGGQITGPYSIDFYGMNNGANSRNFLLTNTGNNFTGNANIFCNDYASARTGASTTLKLGASGVIPNGNGDGIVVFNGADLNHYTILEMNGFNQTINGVSNVSATGAIIRNTSAGTSTLTIGNANTNSTFSGVITDGGAGSGSYLALTKTGTGRVALTGANSYNGNTTVSAGTLAIGQATLPFAATVSVAGGAVLELDYAGANAVQALVLNGVNEPSGTYNSSNSGGLITGTGSLVVGAQSVWTGAFSSLWSTNILSSPKNWTTNGSASDFANGNAVLFNDTLLNNSAVSISATNVLPSNVQFNNSAINYSLQGSFGIAGPTALTKNGTASLTILNTNTYTVGTVLNAGTLEADANSALGTGPVTMSGGLLTNNVSATLGNAVSLSAAANTIGVGSGQSLTVGGPVSNTGALTKTGAGTLIFSGTNTYTGNTTVSAGTMVVSGPYTGSSSGSVFAANGGSLTFNMGLGTANFYGDGYANSMLIADGSTSGTMTLQSGTLNINTISSSGSPYGSFRLGCNTASANGTLNVYGGTLNVPGRILMGANSATATATLTITNGTVNVGSAGTGTYGGANGQGVIWGGTGTKNINLYGGTLTLWSIYSTVGGVMNVTMSGGTLKAFNNNATFTYVTGGTLNLKVSTNGVTINPASYSITIPNTLSHDSAVTGADGGLTINDTVGGGALILSVANTYTGPTTISAGTLLVNSASGTGTGAVNINSGGTLGGNGTIAGVVTNNAGGSLLAGVAGSGTLNVTNGLKLLAGSTNTFAVNGTTPTNTIIALGAGTVSYGGVLNIVTNGTLTVGQTFTLFSGAGATNTGNFASIAGSPGAGKAFSFTNGVLSVVSSGPTLTSVAPNPVTGSSYAVALNLTGSGFTGATAVFLTNVTATTAASYVPMINSDTSITVHFVPGTSSSTWSATVVNGSPSAQAAFTVAVPATASITLANVNSAGAGKLVLSGTGGVAGDSYAVLSATNLNPPVAWSPVVTNVFGIGGSFSYTNTVNSNTPSLFLRIAQ
jgi:autotransporter-associated beta strand protein